MKLYGYIKSERAKKGQGGNKFLEVELMAGSRTLSHTVGYLRIEPVDSDVLICWNGRELERIEGIIGKKQTGE